MAILLEIVQEGIADALSGPIGTGLRGSHPSNGGQGGSLEWAERRVEGSGDSARKMSQSQFPPLDPRNPH